MNYIIAYKPIGQTPLEHIKQLKQERNITDKICFAGRLDPMAHGQMLYLLGDSCKERQMLKLDKVYEFELCFGISTDTDDILGKITDHNLDYEKIPTDFEKYVGTFEQEYHIYSSKCVNGTPLWEHCHNGTIDNITIPSQIVTIYNIEVMENKRISFEEFKHKIQSLINKFPKGNSFRQDEVREGWRTLFSFYDNHNITKMRLRAHVSSGTYIRQFAKDLSKDIGVPIVVTEIHRTEIKI